MKSILELKSYIENMMDKADTNDGSHGHWLDCWYILQDITESMAQRTFWLLKAIEQELTDTQKSECISMALTDIKILGAKHQMPCSNSAEHH